VRILEGALGIELDSSAVCSGEPLTCEADPCSEERCPMSNNLVRRLAHSYGPIAKVSSFLTHLVEVMQEKGVLSEAMVREATLKTRLAEVRADIKESEGLLTVGAGDMAHRTLSVGLDRLRAEVRSLEQEIRELAC